MWKQSFVRKKKYYQWKIFFSIYNYENYISYHISTNSLPFFIYFYIFLGFHLTQTNNIWLSNLVSSFIYKKKKVKIIFVILEMILQRNLLFQVFVYVFFYSEPRKKSIPKKKMNIIIQMNCFYVVSWEEI